MTYRGRIQNGTVVFEEPIELPEGCEVRCEVVTLNQTGVDELRENGPLFEDLTKFAGTATHLPEDAASNLDHYLYGLPKK